MNPSATPHRHPPDHHPLLLPQVPQHPNPSFFLHPSPPPPRAPPPPTTAASQPPSLSSTLSAVSHLLSLSHQTLTSLPPSIWLHSRDDYVPCPYNSDHIMPPHALFLHSLHCPSPLFENPSSLFDSLLYPSTLNPPKTSTFVEPPVKDPQSTELCFSLDTFYNEFTSNFFYKDCPAAVSIRELDSSKRSFTLPSFLSAECVSVRSNSEGEDTGFDKDEFKVLPSGFWGIKRAVESWVEFPGVYSYSVLCAMLRLNFIQRSDLRRWIITNSPRYGVVIDVYVSDHVYALFRICLKAIRTEALSFVGNEMNGKTMSFRCPVLVQVLMWIVSQLSVLYGEVNAKSFAIHVFKQCVLDAANKALVFPLESYLESSSGLDANGKTAKYVALKEHTEGGAGCYVGKQGVKNVNEEEIFVSQVVAAIAALHERSLLELKIKALRFPQPLPRYQRMTEHNYLSMRADEERKKRPNHRAIIQHDGLLRKQTSNQETGKPKTREELLAEERDYKRRRMSYRGKKLKRTTLQVMRDVIDEYMEDIKLAGGIGFFEKGAEEDGTSLNPPSASDVSVEYDERRSNSCYSEATINIPNYELKASDSINNIRSTTFKEAGTQDYAHQGRGYHGHHKPLEYQRKSANLETEDKDYYSQSPKRHRSRSSHREKPDEAEQSRSRDHGRRYSSKYKDQGYKSRPMHDSANKFSLPKDDLKLDVGDRRHRRSYGKYDSNVLAQDSFEDRYDPSESYDTYEYDSYTSRKPEEFHD